MDILIIAPDIYPFQKGYGGRNPINLYDAFSQMGHKTSLLTSVPDRDWKREVSDGLINLFEIVKLHSFSFPPEDFAYFFPPHLRDVRKIINVFHKRVHDLIILNDYFWSLSFLALVLMGKKNRSRTIMLNHGLISPPGVVLKFLFKIFSFVVSRIFISQFIGILSYSKKSHDAISNIVDSHENLFIHPICIDSKQFVKDYENSLLLPEYYFRNKFGITGRFVFAIGGASPHKGYALLIRAFVKLKLVFTDLSLVIAGQFTPHSEDLRRLAAELTISDDIKFIGPINDMEKFLLLRKSSLFLIPSLSEGFGVGALEAEILQLKVVATDTGAHKEILSNNKFARIVIPGNEDSLLEGMKYLLSIDEEPLRILDKEKLNSYSCEYLASFIVSMSKLNTL